MTNKVSEPNENKELKRKVDGTWYARYPIKTQVITPEDDIKKIVLSSIKGKVQDGDIIGVSEKAAAISQGRAYPKDEIKPSWLANFLVKFVTKSKRGVGISSPETFQLAIDECGSIRIIIAAIIGGLAKLIGIKGVFYNLAGNEARLIDGAAEYVIPPYNTYVSKGPAEPDKTCQKIAKQLDKKAGVALIDINDYGGQVVGASENIKDRDKICKILEDNPLGQTDEQTPIVIIRKLSQ